MASDRIQSLVQRLLDQADEAALQSDWPTLRRLAEAACAADPDNADARRYLAMAERGEGTAQAPPTDAQPVEAPPAEAPAASAARENGQRSAQPSPDTPTPVELSTTAPEPSANDRVDEETAAARPAPSTDDRSRE